MTPATIAAAVMARTTWAIAPGVPISSRSRGTPIATTMRDTHHGRPVGMGCGRRMNGRPIPLVKRIRLRLLARVDKANACSLNLHRIVVGVEPTVAASSHLAELLAAVDRFRQRPKTNRQPQELAAELKGIRHATDLLELEFSQTAAAFSKTEEYEEEGSVSPIDWIRHQCRMSTGAVWNSLAVGEHLDELPRSVEAVESAEIGYAHLTLMARTADSVQGSSTAAPFEEGGLLDKAREYSVGRLWYFCHHMRHATDPEEFAAEQSRATEARTLKMRTYVDGSPAGDVEYSLPVSAATVQRLACDSTLTRVVLAPESVVIDVGRARRVVAGAMRRALIARDGHCKWPRCERPASFSDAHHVIHWI